MGNVKDAVISVASRIIESEDVSLELKLDDRVLKFNILTALMEEFDHSIPNTELNVMNTLSDAVAFFSIPVSHKSPYDDMAENVNKPKNLHIQLDPLRFDPETDTFFDGQT